MSTAATRLDWDGVRRPLDTPALPPIFVSTARHTARRAATAGAVLAGSAGAEAVALAEGGPLLAAVLTAAGLGLGAVVATVAVVSHHLVETRDRELARAIREEYYS